jgi:hypothetical protein
MRIGNKERILDIVLNYTIRKGGIQPKEIHKLMNISPMEISLRVIQDHLRVLLLEKKVRKRTDIGHRREYRTTHRLLRSPEGFAHTMTPMGKRMIHTIWLKPEIIDNAPTYDSTLDIDRHLEAKGIVIGLPIGDDRYSSSIYGITEPEHEFYESMNRDDITISSKYCQTKFGEAEKKERYMFEFVNRVGAFITYAFFKSLNTLSEKSAANSAIAKLIIDNAIDLNGIFREFQNLCLFLKEKPEEISNAFRRVYPSAEILEKYWSDRVRLSKTSYVRTVRDKNNKSLILSK